MLGTCAVIGQALGHSLSPRIHQAFADQFGEKLVYRKLETGDFETAAARFFASGACGLNVTLPFKQRAFQLAEVNDELATNAAAVNTLYRRGGKLCGSNTDGVGLVQDLTANLNIQLGGKSLLILGAGGAGRGIIGPLLTAGVESITVANRTPARAEQLVAELAPHASTQQRLRYSGLNDIPLDHYDLVINATSAGIGDAIPKISPTSVLGGLCYNLLYGAKAAVFCRWALDHGARQAFDGLGMLVCQAAQSFFLWHDLQPDAAAVIRLLQQSEQ